MSSTLLARPRPPRAPAVVPPPVRAPHGRPGLPSLTGLRWWAALLVMALHLSNAGYLSGPVAALVAAVVRPGTAGVSLFFVLSGFVLAWSAAPGQRPGAFWRRRFARVYPLHLVTAVAALLIGAFWAPSLRPDGPAETLANLALVSAWRPAWWQALNPVSWTLTCEAFFYLLFPGLLCGLRRLSDRGLRVAAALSALTVVMLPFADLVVHGGWPLSTNPALRLPEFVVGVAVAMLVRRGIWHGPSTTTTVVLTVVGYVLAGLVPDGCRAACTIVGFASLIPALARADLDGARTPLSHPVVVRLGEWSFAIYLVHLLVIRCLDPFGLGGRQLPLLTGVVLVLAVAAAAVGLGALAHRGVERPARRLVLGNGHGHGQRHRSHRAVRAARKARA